MKNQNYSLTIGWLYPDLMSTYGDRGNIICLQKRCEWRGIKTEIVNIDQNTISERLKTIDLIFGGGAQDTQQEIVMRDLRGKKAEVLKEMIENDTPALFVCGAPQLMGKYYEPAIGKRIEGIGIFDMETKNPGLKAPRCIGNIIAEVIGFEFMVHGKYFNKSTTNQELITHNVIVGFENHGGRTYLGKTAKAFAKVIKGYGNNGEDGTEGVVYKNAIGCYFHGPLLPKNPHLADWLITKSLEVKYHTKIYLSPLDDMLEWQAHEAVVKKKLELKTFR